MVKHNFTKNQRTKYAKERKEFYEEITRNLNLFKEYNTILKASHFSGCRDVENTDDDSGSPAAGVRTENLHVHDFIVEYYDPCIETIDSNINQLQKRSTVILASNEKNVKMLLNNMEDKSRLGNFSAKGPWNSEFKESAIELVSYIFAIWTLQNSQYYVELGQSSGGSDDRSYLKQPRDAQIVPILRLLSIDDKGTKFQRNLIGIGVGGGKSLTLAVTSCILALLGFDVSCML